jgi:hypothetical protein
MKMADKPNIAERLRAIVEGRVMMRVTNGVTVPASMLIAAADEIARLRAELSAAIGYMTNAKIDLDTGAPKRTALATIDGGIKRARAALGEKP